MILNDILLYDGKLRMTSHDSLIRWLRQWRLLSAVDTLRYFAERVRNYRINSRFIAENPNYPVPPPALAFDAYGYIHWPLYRNSGIQHARLLLACLQPHLKRPLSSLLEWGCGPGRVIRHLREELPETVELVGCDVNPKSIAWCRAYLPGIRFFQNVFTPPLPLESGAYDVIIARSVFTHLSEAMHHAWRDELVRVLKSDGLLIVTTQGRFFRDLHLSADEQRRFDAGELVVRGHITEGRKWFSAFHPESFMRERFFVGMKILEYRPGPVAPLFEQDLWIATPGS